MANSLVYNLSIVAAHQVVRIQGTKSQPDQQENDTTKDFYCTQRPYPGPLYVTLEFVLAMEGFLELTAMMPVFVEHLTMFFLPLENAILRPFHVDV